MGRMTDHLRALTELHEAGTPFHELERWIDALPTGDEQKAALWLWAVAELEDSAHAPSWRVAH